MNDAGIYERKLISLPFTRNLLSICDVDESIIVHFCCSINVTHPFKTGPVYWQQRSRLGCLRLYLTATRLMVCQYKTEALIVTNVYGVVRRICNICYYSSIC